MTKTELFRKIIREEVVKALKQELPGILKEITKASDKPLVRESRSAVPLTLNTAPPPPPKFAGLDPISALLNETAMDMVRRPQETEEWPTIGRDSSHVGASMGFVAPAAVGGVGDMLATSRNSVALEAVEVSVVPNFNNLMDSLISKGHM